MRILSEVTKKAADIEEVIGMKLFLKTYGVRVIIQLDLCCP